MYVTISRQLNAVSYLLCAWVGGGEGGGGWCDGEKSKLLSSHKKKSVVN